ncbi:MAG: UpxY family transcription antiterminator [Bryobacteraceae bacterium]|jgi:transcription antitermination factor NusG
MASTTNTPDTAFIAGLAADVKPWYAIRVRSRFEFTTSNILRDKGFEQFLPLCRSRRRWSDRVKELDMPLFPGYVFCRFDASSPLQVLTTPGVVHIISAGKAPIPVDQREIAALQDICGSGLPVQPWPYLEVGRRVLIERGPLAGAEGIIVEMKGRFRLVASISILHRSVAAEIDRDWIRPLL